MGTSCLEQNAIVEIDGRGYRLHRKITDTCWQLEELKTGLLVTKEHHELLQMVAKQQLAFPAQHPGKQTQPRESPSPRDRKIAENLRPCSARRSQFPHSDGTRNQ